MRRCPGVQTRLLGSGGEARFFPHRKNRHNPVRTHPLREVPRLGELKVQWRCLEFSPRQNLAAGNTSGSENHATRIDA